MEKTIWPGSTQLAPSPVVLVGTGDGRRFPWNLLTVAWAGTVCSDPPMVGIGVRKSRFSYRALKELRCFTVNLPTAEMAEAVDFCGVASGADTDKFAARQLTAAKANKIVAPLVAECPLSLECAVRQVVELGSHDLFLGEVIAVQVGPGRDNTTEHAVVYFDGASSVQLVTGDRVEIRKAENDARIVRINQDSFLETLRRKMSAI